MEALRDEFVPSLLGTAEQIEADLRGAGRAGAYRPQPRRASD